MKYFGTDGIRGTYGDLEVSEPFLRALGLGVADYIKEYFSGNGKVVVGGDTRASTETLKEAFISALKEGGIECEDVGILPTPALAYSVLQKKAIFGAMITASHNPYCDNGIKFFDANALKISDEVQLAFEQKLEAHLSDVSGYAPKTFEPREIVAGGFAQKDYVSKMSSIFPKDFLKGLKIAIDMANGATSKISSSVFRAYGAEVFEKSCNPDGININSGVGSQYPEQIASFCREVGADVGFAHDGDGDRVVVVDENASILEGEEVLYLIAEDAATRGILKGGAIVTTLQSNLGLDEALQGLGIGVHRSGIGDRLVMQMMLENGCNIGGENSGHFIFSEISPCGDGLAAALSVLSVMVSKKAKLSQLRGAVAMFPSQSKAIKVARKTPIEETPTLAKVIEQSSNLLGSSGRLLVRYSGTEKKIRLLVEGRDIEIVKQIMQELEKCVENDLQ